MSVRVYDFGYKLLAETDRAFSREWNLRFNGIGSFEGSFDISGEMCRVFADNRVLVLTDGDKQCVCTGSKIGNRLFVYGRTPEWLLSKRVVLPFKSREIFGEEYTDPETIALYLLGAAYKTPHLTDSTGAASSVIDSDAVCEDLILPEEGTSAKLERYFWRNAANTLSDVIGDLCDLCGEGYRLRFCPEEKLWRFEFVRGRTLDLIISKSLKNAYDMTLSHSVIDSAAGGYYELSSDKAEDETRTYGYLEGERNGTGLLKWETVLSGASGESEARSKLAACTDAKKIDCEVTGARYGTDYELGDVLRVQAEIGGYRATLSRRITGVSIICDSNGTSVKPEFEDI